MYRKVHYHSISDKNILRHVAIIARRNTMFYELFTHILPNIS